MVFQDTKEKTRTFCAPPSRARKARALESLPVPYCQELLTSPSPTEAVSNLHTLLKFPSPLLPASLSAEDPTFHVSQGERDQATRREHWHLQVSPPALPRTQRHLTATSEVAERCSHPAFTATSRHCPRVSEGKDCKIHLDATGSSIPTLSQKNQRRGGKGARWQVTVERRGGATSASL